MNSLLSFQSVVARSLIVLSLVHVVILAAIAWLNGGPVLLTATAAALLAATPVVFWLLKRPMGWVGLALAVTLVGQTSLLVGVMAGHPWQIEMHFYYFAILAMVAGFCEWRVLLATAALIAVHHLSLNWLLPAAVFPGGADIARVSVHAAVVVVETVMLAGIGLTIRTAFRHADAARQEAEQAARQLEATAGNRQKELQAETERSERIGVLLDGFQREMSSSTTTLHEAAEDLRQDADRLGRAATHANAQSATAAGASEDTEAKVRSAAHAGEELAQTIADVGSNAARSSQLANSAVAEATRTKATIDELATVALEIDRVTDLISAIASQTNLLALNATIEAARAGEAGRGFAVVAQEVKALAGQTAAATHEIGQRIAAMKDATSRSVDAIAAISGIIRELDLFSAKIASAVEQQAAAAHQIAGSAAAAFASVGQVHGAIGEIEDVVEQTAQAAGKLGGAASHVSGQVQAIRDTVSTLTENLQAVRA